MLPGTILPFPVLEGVQYRIGDMVDGSGRAEVYLNGRWGTVCNRYWGDNDADVFCRSLGNYVGGIETKPKVPGDVTMPMWMTSVGCTGNETNLLQCKAIWARSEMRFCFHSNDAGVTCFKSGNTLI